MQALARPARERTAPIPRHAASPSGGGGRRDRSRRSRRAAPRRHGTRRRSPKTTSLAAGWARNAPPCYPAVTPRVGSGVPSCLVPALFDAPSLVAEACRMTVLSVDLHRVGRGLPRWAGRVFQNRCLRPLGHSSRLSRTDRSTSRAASVSCVSRGRRRRRRRRGSRLRAPRRRGSRRGKRPRGRSATGPDDRRSRAATRASACRRSRDRP